jgi:hypothetical protein
VNSLCHKCGHKPSYKNPACDNCSALKGDAMTEFQTTKIGDRWFLVHSEGLIPVDLVTEITARSDMKFYAQTAENEHDLFELVPVKLPATQPQFTQYDHESGLAAHIRFMNSLSPEQRAALDQSCLTGGKNVVSWAWDQVDPTGILRNEK